MKKIFSSAIILIALASCEKEAVKPVSAVAEQEAPAGPVKPPSGMRTWYDWGWDYGCYHIPRTCFPDVIVTPRSYQQRLAPLFDVIHSGNQEQTSQYLLENQKDLSEFISNEMLDGAIHQKYILDVVDRNPSLPIYLQFVVNGDTTIAATYPFQVQE